MSQSKHDNTVLDFPVHVTPMSIEASEEYNVFNENYRGVFEITLNWDIDVLFSPRLEREKYSWPPTLPEVRNDSETLRLGLAIEYGSFVVTAEDSLAGTVEQIKFQYDASVFHNLYSPEGTIGFEERVTTIFYVKTLEYTKFDEEFEEIGMSMMGIYAFEMASNLQKYSFIRFITNQIIKSDFFTEKDMSILRRVKNDK